MIGIVFVAIAIELLALQSNPIAGIASGSGTMSQLIIPFVTGLTTGGLSCLAVQGGLLASSIAHEVEQSVKDAPARPRLVEQARPATRGKGATAGKRRGGAGAGATAKPAAAEPRAARPIV